MTTATWRSSASRRPSGDRTVPGRPAPSRSHAAPRRQRYAQAPRRRRAPSTTCASGVPRVATTPTTVPQASPASSTPQCADALISGPSQRHAHGDGDRRRPQDEGLRTRSAQSGPRAGRSLSCCTRRGAGTWAGHSERSPWPGRPSRRAGQTRPRRQMIGRLQSAPRATAASAVMSCAHTPAPSSLNVTRELEAMGGPIMPTTPRATITR